MSSFAFMFAYDFIFVGEKTLLNKEVPDKIGEFKIKTTSYETQKQLLENLDNHKASKNNLRKYFENRNIDGNFIVLTKGCLISVQQVVNQDEIFKKMNDFYSAEKDIILILGEPAGLEKELKDDFYSVLLLEEFGTPKIDSDIIYSEDLKKRILVLDCPSKETLKEFFSAYEFIGRYAAVYFCGHGNPDGTILLKDYEYINGEEFIQIIENAKMTMAGNDFGIYINSCFALQFVKKMDPKQDFTNSFLNEMHLASLSINGEIPSQIKGLEEFPDKVCKMKDDEFAKILQKMKSSLGVKSLTFLEPTKERTFPIYLHPLSIGFMNAKGMLLIFSSVPDFNVIFSESPFSIFRTVPFKREIISILFRRSIR
jgi:hypothetical protein